MEPYNLLYQDQQQKEGVGNGYFTSSLISLPFFNDGWWSVQLQRLTHISASNENSTLNEFELRVANNIYDGYDGNQIGFQGSASITMPDGNVTSSLNAAWNKFDVLTSANSVRYGSGLNLGGLMWKTEDPAIGAVPNQFVGAANRLFPAYPASYGKNVGGSFLGQFQEFRYYRRAFVFITI